MNHGGSRPGAGRKREHGRTTGQLVVDIGRLHRNGYLERPLRLEWSWSSGGRVIIDTSPGSITLIYAYRRGDAEWTNVRRPVSIDRAACHLGGSRPWFVCPACSARCSKLYIAASAVCRRCAGLRYPVHSDDEVERSWRRTRKLEARLSGGTGPWDGTKPKRMRWATYYQLAGAHVREQQYRTARLVAVTQQMLSPYAGSPAIPN